MLKNNNDKFNLNEEIKDVFGKNLNICMQKINNFIPKYKLLKDKNLKQAEMCQLLFELCLN